MHVPFVVWAKIVSVPPTRAGFFFMISTLISLIVLVVEVFVSAASTQRSFVPLSTASAVRRSALASPLISVATFAQAAIPDIAFILVAPISIRSMIVFVVIVR